jgi:anti-sigma B factor antagonist
MGSGLTVRVRREHGCAVVTVAGEVDIATVAQLRERLCSLAGSGVPVIADLDQVTFIDAAGVGALVGAASQATARGVSLRVVCARPRTRRLFRLTKADRYLPLARTVAEALQDIAAGEAVIGSVPSSPERSAPAWPHGRQDPDVPL